MTITEKVAEYGSIHHLRIPKHAKIIYIDPNIVDYDYKDLRIKMSNYHIFHIRSFYLLKKRLYSRKSRSIILKAKDWFCEIGPLMTFKFKASSGNIKEFRKCKNRFKYRTIRGKVKWNEED